MAPSLKHSLAIGRRSFRPGRRCWSCQPIIRGQTPHFDYIASEVARGISQAALTTGLPVIFGIVTADTVDQALDRAGVKLGNKGFEAAMTAVELVNLYREAFE